VSNWLMLVAFGALLLAADEARKAWHRRAGRRMRERGPDRAAGPCVSGKEP
jgi:hypothetical protein